MWSAVALGGAIGGLARHGLNLAIPHEPGVFAWSTFLSNITGCFLIGVLMVLVSDVVPRLRLLRPFLGVGVLGGYTTFSTHIDVAQVHIDEAQQLLVAGSAGFALVYMAGTAVGALLAVWIGVRATQAAFRARIAAGRR
ncbi:fluoride efflux transporter FluC [Allosalinactinospora lopnorensis]|uniref:fluoride efflux transporter FluC n=1 Tax=Allosalinactinospora lopnorensis TaxID=1352348 RepID=UPI001F276456|nr:CrcB family protein [Allosalinactinospora lopnorensis]